MLSLSGWQGEVRDSSTFSCSQLSYLSFTSPCCSLNTGVQQTYLKHQLLVSQADTSGWEGKERQDKSLKHVANTSGISSQSLDNMLHLDFNSVTAEHKKKKKPHKTHHKQSLLLHLGPLLTWRQLRSALAGPNLMYFPGWGSSPW